MGPVALTGLERVLSFSIIMALFLPTSNGFTSLTAIIAVLVEWHGGTSLCHGVCPHRALAYEEGSAKLQTRMAEESPITSSPGKKFVGWSNS
ncbi:hypothetical protein AVEN_233287-1 [Araneus ventricosus]|uniref:Uncharacterized protein n=1 Tax=Araneus ventricosus TaxID=182803 RepID=A0A4Y2H4W6_ARAVE|nr:hypothetical protein AVEN_102023-1 [Araneus ventricosus]GBM61173.1 hypothetical protein AVEN_233189-1 [Araneus ventricosus]GBM61228.1 hypothetical protein AVEN_36957-1 [Araneus ventricosus]GBM61920.1 hypothetical protein AVEN_233287-1 [Araneus ventricosus]